jgi:hypothetical protein
MYVLVTVKGFSACGATLPPNTVPPLLMTCDTFVPRNAAAVVLVEYHGNVEFTNSAGSIKGRKTLAVGVPERYNMPWTLVL